jgi:hypothetical protein
MNVHIVNVHRESHSPLLNNLISTQESSVYEDAVEGDSMGLRGFCRLDGNRGCMLYAGRCFGRSLMDLNWKEGWLLRAHHGTVSIGLQRRESG